MGDRAMVSGILVVVLLATGGPLPMIALAACKTDAIARNVVVRPGCGPYPARDAWRCGNIRRYVRG